MLLNVTFVIVTDRLPRVQSSAPPKDPLVELDFRASRELGLDGVPVVVQADAVHSRVVGSGAYGKLCSLMPSSHRRWPFYTPATVRGTRRAGGR